MSLAKPTTGAPAPLNPTGGTGLKDHGLTDNAGAKTNTPSVEAAIKLIEKLGVEDLVAVRYKVDSMLPINLEDLDLGQELALQYAAGRALLAAVQTDATIPTNQKSQIFNAVRAQLADIVKQQESVWGMERLKKFEVALVKAANLMNPEAKAAFFDLYSQYLKGGVIANTPVEQVGLTSISAQAAVAGEVHRVETRPAPVTPSPHATLAADKVDRAAL